MPGKRTMGGRSHSRDARVKREASKLKKLEQKFWRRDCLFSKTKLSEKNAKEAESLGLLVTRDSEGKITGVLDKLTEVLEY